MINYKSLFLTVISGYLLIACTAKDPVAPAGNNNNTGGTNQIITGTTCGIDALSFAPNRLSFLGNCYKVESIQELDENNVWTLKNTGNITAKESIATKVIFDERPMQSGVYYTVKHPLPGKNCMILLDNFVNQNDIGYYAATSGYPCTVQVAGGMVEVTFDKIEFTGTSTIAGKTLVSARLKNIL